PRPTFEPPTAAPPPASSGRAPLTRSAFYGAECHTFTYSTTDYFGDPLACYSWVIYNGLDCVYQDGAYVINTTLGDYNSGDHSGWWNDSVNSVYDRIYYNGAIAGLWENPGTWGWRVWYGWSHVYTALGNNGIGNLGLTIHKW